MLDFIITPIISASIGYITNKIAINMLFSPKKPIFGIQGLFIKRKADLADNLSLVIVERLIASGLDKITSNKIESVIEKVSYDMAVTITNSSGCDSPENLIPVVSGIIKTAVYKSVMLSDIGPAENNIAAMKEIIKSNFMAIDDIEFENLVRHIAGKEFRDIEIIGAILGALIGFVNAGVTTWL